MSIDPPDSQPPPKWARTLVNAANGRNRVREADDVFSMADLIAAWNACGGRCRLSGMPFSLEVIGDGQAKHPFAPSLDRIDRHRPYCRDNVRLVVSIANFAMNAWGEKPLQQLASALHHKRGDREPPSEPTPSDGELDDIATLDSEPAETDIGILPFPPRPDMHPAILQLLRRGPRPSREIENELATRFGITSPMRTAKLGNGHPAWRNHVAWALQDLVSHKNGRRGTGQIERIGSERTRDGGSMGIYRLISN